MTGNEILNEDCGKGLNYDNTSHECQNRSLIRCQRNLQKGKLSSRIESDEMSCCADSDMMKSVKNSNLVSNCHLKRVKQADQAEQIFINNVKGSVTLVVKEQQSSRTPQHTSNIYLKPQDPRLQFKSIQLNNSQKEGEETSSTAQQEEQTKSKRRLGFGQSLKRKDDRSLSKSKPSKSTSDSSLPKPQNPPKFTMSQLWHQKMQIYQHKSMDAKHNLLQIQEDLNLLASELEEVRDHGNQLQIQIQQTDLKIEKLDEYPEEGEVGLEDDSCEDDDESLTSAHLPEKSYSLSDYGEEVDQKLNQQNLYLHLYSSNNGLRQSYKLVVDLLRIHKIVQVRQNNNSQISQVIKEENLEISQNNERSMNALMPCVQKRVFEKKNNQVYSNYQRNSTYLKNLLCHYCAYEIRQALVYRRQMHQYKKLLRDSNLEDDDDEELDMAQPLINSVKYKPQKLTKFRTLRSTELAHAVKTIKKGIAIPNQHCKYHVYGRWQKIRSGFMGYRSKIDDPIGEMRQELVGSPWTQRQKNLFVQTFLQYPKEFEKIASFIPGRTSRECIAFYYRNQKQEWFAPTKRKLHLMRRQRRQDLRKAESFMQINKASQQRMNIAQSNITNNNIVTPIVTNTNTVKESVANNIDTKINCKIDVNRVSEKQLFEKQQIPVKAVQEGIKSLFELTTAQRGRRSKRKRAKEISVPKLQPPMKRRCIIKAASKISSPPATKQKSPKSRENSTLSKEAVLDNSSPTNSTVAQNKRAKQDKHVEEVSKKEDFKQSAQIRSKRVKTFKQIDFVDDGMARKELNNNNNDSNEKNLNNQWESIREPLQIPPLFKNGFSTAPFKTSSFFTDLLQPLQKCTQASLFVPPESNNNNNHVKYNSNMVKKDNISTNNCSSKNKYLQPSLTSLLEETMHQALGETTSLFQSNLLNLPTTNSLLQFGSKDLTRQLNLPLCASNRPSASSSPSSFTLGRSPTLVEIQKQIEQVQQRQNISLQSSGPPFPPRKFEPSSKFSSQNYNLGLNSKSIFDQVFSSQNQPRFLSSKQSNSPFYLKEQLQQQQLLQGSPQIQQFGQQLLEQQQQQQQQQQMQLQQPHSINSLDSILEKGSAGFNNSLRQFQLDQYLFSQVGEGGLKCTGGFDGGASNRNIDGDSFDGL